MNHFCVRRVPGVLLSIACSVAVSFNTTSRASVETSLNAAVNGTIKTIALQTDGKVLIGGLFTQVNGTTRSYLARLNVDGSLDGSFAPASAPAQYVYRVEVSGTKIYVGAGDGLRCYDANGALQWHYPMQAKTFAVDAQQRVIFGGQFTRVDNQPHRNVARLSAGGTLDTTFAAQVGCCAGEGVFALATQGDAALVGGAFQSVNGTTAQNVALLDGSGTLPAGFSASATANVVALLPVAGGGFFAVSDRALVRHDATGAADASFGALELGSADERFLAAAVQADGKVVVGGQFTGGNLVRLEPDGTVDGGFSITTDGAVHALAVEGDGSLLVAGEFTMVNGTPRSGIARISNSASSAPAPTLRVAVSQAEVTLSWDAVAGSYVLEAKDVTGGAWSGVDAPVMSQGSANSAKVPAAGAGRLYRLRAAN